jgi:cation transport ATPase
MLGTRIRLTKYPVRVLIYNDLSDRSRGAERTDSGIVSKKSVKALLTAFTLCDKTKHITKTNLLICALTLIIGMVIVAGVSFMGTIAAVGSVYAALFQLFWLIPVYLISRFLLM